VEFWKNFLLYIYIYELFGLNLLLQNTLIFTLICE
jgi:hypothetical protein